MEKMILRMPDYCSEFKCIADKCRDNCCIGWEIDIDKKSEEYYLSCDGEFGNKLRNNIQKGQPGCFILGEKERCPFLNKKNLCEIIINLGEDKLCHICSEHPRYYEWYNGVKEGGTGLCCEESARIIISRDKPFSYIESETCDDSNEEYDENLYKCLFSARNKIINHLQNRGYTFFERINDVLMYAENLQYQTDNGEYTVPDIIHSAEIRKTDIKKFLEFLCTLEMLDPNREKYLRSCILLSDKTAETEEKFKNKYPETELYLENVAVYFIWRHFLKGVFSEEFYSAVFFTALSCEVIRFLSVCCYHEDGKFDITDFIRIAKDYSKETEYSEKNMSVLLDEAYNNNYFLL